MQRERRIETEVVRCIGENDFFIQVPFTFPEAALPFYIEDVTIKLQDYNLNIALGECCDSVIFSGELFINVLYKYGTTANDTNGLPTNTGYIAQQTKLAPIAGCIPMECEKFRECCKTVQAKLIDICITESHTLTNPVDETVDFPFYNGLTESICVKVKAKIVTDEIIQIPFEDDCNCCKCENDCK